MKFLLAALVSLALALGGLLAGALPAFAAATPAPTPTSTSGPPSFVEYQGIDAYSSVDSHDFKSKKYSGHAIVSDCTTGSCAITVFTVDDPSGKKTGAFDITQGRTLTLVNGVGTFDLPAKGDICGPVWIGKGVLTITATATGFTGTRTSAGSGLVHCSSSSTAQSPNFVVHFSLPVVAGNACIVDNSCPKPVAHKAHRATVTPSSVIPHGTKANSPSTLSTLAPVQTALTVRNLLWAATVTVVLVLLIAFPTHVFNTATEKSAEQIKEWWAQRRPKRLPKVPARAVEFTGWPIAAAGLLAASLISSFVDPSFGFNPSSIRVFGSILVSFLLDAVVGWFLLIWLVRRTTPNATASFRFAPISLVVVLGAVLFTRFTGFAPGIIFGLVAGVAFGAILATAEKAKVALIGLGYSFVVAVIGWIGYSILNATAGAHPAAGIIFIQETLSSMAVGGIAALPIALIPLRGLTGHDVFTWNRWAWAGAYAVGLIGFFVVLMPMPFSWAGVHINLWVWIGVYVGYALLAVAAWLVISRPWKKSTEAAPATSPDPA